MGTRLLAIAIALAPGAPPAGAEAADNTPARIDSRNVRLKKVDGKLTGDFEYHLVVGTFYEWNTDPTAVPGLMSEVTARTGIRAKVNFSPIGLDEERIRRNPLLIMTGNRFFTLTDAEKANLRAYLRAGGFIYADDCGGADRSFRIMIRDLLPDSRLVELPNDHPIYRSHYKLDGPPKILDLYHGPAKGLGARLNGRLAVFYTYDTDIPCGWEKNPDGSYVHVLDKARHERSFRMGVNVVTYVLEELYKGRRGAGPARRPASAPAPAEARPFAGGELRRYVMDLKLPVNLIRAIAPAGRHVWFGGRRMLPGEQEGLGRYDYRTGEWRIFLDSEGVLADEINVLAAEPDGGLWIGTSTIRRRWNYGLWHYDPRAGRSRRYTRDDGLVDFDVYDLLLAGGKLYAATRSGLAIYDPKTGKWSADPTHHRNYVDLTLCLAFDGRRVWMGRAGGLRCLDTRTGEYRQFGAANSPIDGMVNALALDGDRLWISCPPKLLVREDGRFRVPQAAAAIARHNVTCAAADAKLLCLGTRTGGLHVLDRATRKWRAVTAPDPLPCPNIARVVLDDRSIWLAFGDDPLGLGRCDRKTGRWSFHTHRAGIPCNHLYCLLGHKDALYVGTMANGLWKHLPAADRWVNLNLAHRAEHEPVRRADVYDMLIRGDTLWFGTNVGLCRLPHGRTAYEHIEGLPSATAVAALVADGRTILCGTKQRGLLAYDTTARKWTDLNRQWHLPARPVGALALAGDLLYVGGEDGLLVVHRPTGKARAVADLLAGKRVTCLRADAHGALVGTSAGLFRYDAKTTGVRPLTASELSIQSLLRPAARGPLLVGTSSGLLAADGAKIRRDPRFAEHVIRAMAAHGEHLWIGTLGHGLIRSRPPAGPVP